MTQTAEPVVADVVSISLSRKLATHLVQYTPTLAERLHRLLARNTNGDLNATEREELEALAELAQVKQLLALALEGGAAA